jgi:O-antigen/teichoic acid export membrane protein
MISWNESKAAAIADAAAGEGGRFTGGRSSRFPRLGFANLGIAHLRPVAFSMADQALSVGGMFLANVALARSQSREEYGNFALSCSALVFLLGLHNAALLEPFTIFGAGRYRQHFAEYFRLIAWSNAALGVLLSAPLLGVFFAFRWLAPGRLPPMLLGLGLAVSFLFSGTLLRRVFYLERRPQLAAAASLIFFLTVVTGLGLAQKLGRLDGLSVFLVLATGWLTAIVSLAAALPWSAPSGTTPATSFLAAEPGYWREHWNYSRWVLATAFVFQMTTQGYYWLVAGLLSVKDVATLKAIALVIAPAEQIFIALNYLVLPSLCARYAAGNIAGLRLAWKWYAIAITAATLSFFLLICACGKPLTHLLYGGRYDDASPLLSLLVLVPVVMGVGHTMNAALKAAERPRLVFWAYVCSGAVTFAAGVPLVARCGVRGAVYGMLASGAAYTAALSVGLFFTFRRLGFAAREPQLQPQV